MSKEGEAKKKILHFLLLHLQVLRIETVWPSLITSNPQRKRVMAGDGPLINKSSPAS
jgi:hypothetical protein